VRWAVEATYEGSVRFDEANLDATETIEPMVGALTRWIASTLVLLPTSPVLSSSRSATTAAERATRARRSA